jgi:hypothetical protein
MFRLSIEGDPVANNRLATGTASTNHAALALRSHGKPAIAPAKDDSAKNQPGCTMFTKSSFKLRGPAPCIGKVCHHIAAILVPLIASVGLGSLKPATMRSLQQG